MLSEIAIRCWDCGEDIPEKRLEVLPRALRCVECQQEKERADQEARRLEALEHQEVRLPKLRRG